MILKLLKVEKENQKLKMKTENETRFRFGHRTPFSLLSFPSKRPIYSMFRSTSSINFDRARDSSRLLFIFRVGKLRNIVSVYGK